MKQAGKVAVGIAGIVLVVFSENLFGQQSNAFFLRMPGIDKVLHVLEYALVFAGVYALGSRLRPSRRLMVACVVGAALPILDETVQALAPDRSVEFLDVTADWAGVTLGWVVVCRPVRQVAAVASAAAVSVAAYATYDTHSRLIDFSRALRYERQGDFVHARESYLRALEAGLRTAALYNELGWVEIESGVGDPRQAVEYAEMALSMNPGDPDTLDTYGWALHHAGRSAEALEPLTQALTAKPGIYSIHYHLGSVYLALGRRDLAASHLRQQVALAGTREAALAARALDTMAARQ